MTTPPGWYPDPDPAQRVNSPSAERWWDGAAWTGQTRTKAAVRGPLVAGVVGAAVLVAALIVSAVLNAALSAGAGAARGDEARGGGSDNRPAPPGERPEEPGDQPPDGSGRDVPATGVDLPVLEGWEHDPFGPVVTTGPYECPGGKSDSCLRGSSSIVVATAPSGASAEDTAKRDIARFAKSAYSKGTYGGITSHDAVESEKTSVAGQDAYRVRWKIVNRTKPDAYVESVAFTHPDGSGEMLLLRTGFDIAKSAPPLSDMDKLAEGITRDDSGTGADAGGGNGESV
jgi:Protein of unknown function (DUF2510)